MITQPRRPVALVTGGRQGLGKACALSLARKGFDLVIADLARDERTEETLAELAAAGAGVTFIEADIARTEAHAELTERAWSAFGGLDCLVNNAGVAARPLCDILELSTDAFDLNLGVNLRGSFFLTQSVARCMLKHTSPFYRSIVFITSIAAGHVSIDRAQYCISKAGLSMTAQIYAVRLAEAGIHVHEVRPGFIRTEMTASAGTAKIDAYIESGAVPLRRWGQPEDVGALTAALAAGDLPYVDGQPIYVAGAFQIPTA